MKMKLFCVVVLCACLFSACDKDNDEYEPVKPPIEQPEEPVEPEEPEEPDNPVTPLPIKDIINVKIGDLNMIVGSNNWNAVAYGNGKYVAVGNNGYVTSSSDGINWEAPKLVGNSTWHDVKYINGKFMAVGGSNTAGSKHTGLLMTSTDGLNWIGPTTISSSDNLTYSIAYGNGKYVAVGYPVSISTSTDSTNWKLLQSGPANSIFTSVIFAEERFILVDNYGGVRISLDGDTFTYVNAKGNELHDIAYGNGKFVAIGKNICVSTDGGETWVAKNIPGGNEYYAIVFNNGKFVAIGKRGYYMVSEDGINWSTQTNIKNESGIAVSANLNGLCVVSN